MEETMVPWFEMGEDVQGSESIRKAMEKGGLDFEVEKTPIYVMSQDSTSILPPDLTAGTLITRVPGYFATRRTDNMTPLGVVGKIYEVVQNADAFELFEPLVEEGELRLLSAGCLGCNGEKVWVLAEVGDPVLLVPGDELKRYVVLINSHDGSSSMWLSNTPTSTVRGSFYADKQILRIRHTTLVRGRLAEARKVLGRSLELYDGFLESAQAMVAQKLQSVDVDRLLGEMFPARIRDGVPVYSPRAQKQMEIIKALYSDEPVVAARGTAWALFNAVSRFVDHYRSPVDTKEQRYRRLRSISIGAGAAKKREAFAVLSRRGT